MCKVIASEAVPHGSPDRKSQSINLTYIATCSIDHLADHCNGEGESLLSIDCPASGFMREQAQQALAIALCMEGDYDAPELCLGTRKELANHAIDSLHRSCLHPWSDAGDRLACDPEGEVKLWFKLEY
jgi:hypothetical protein